VHCIYLEGLCIGLGMYGHAYMGKGLLFALFLLLEDLVHYYY
jgi:hypothetical protein